MKRTMPHLLVLALAMAILAGCGGDIGQRMVQSPELQSKVMGAITRNAPLATAMLDSLMGSDSTRTLVVNQLLANGTAAQEVMMRIAKDPSKIDGVLGLAAQDSVLRSHLIGFLEGMKATRR